MSLLFLSKHLLTNERQKVSVGCFSITEKDKVRIKRNLRYIKAFLFTLFHALCLCKIQRERERQGEAEPVTFCSCVYHAECSSALDLSPLEGGDRGR